MFIFSYILDNVSIIHRPVFSPQILSTKKIIVIIIVIELEQFQIYFSAAKLCNSTILQFTILQLFLEYH